MDDSQYSLRTAQLDDSATIALHRAAMFRDMGLLDDQEFSGLKDASEAWITQCMISGAYAGWLIESGGNVIAGAGILLRKQGPIPGCLHVAYWAHVVNVYTDPKHRRQGLARRLMHAILDWCKANGVEQVTLSSSEEGRALYESLGFEPTADMKLAVSAQI